MKQIIRFFKEEDGATVPEYALMVALIAVVCVAAVTAVGTQVDAVFNQAATDLTP